MLVYTSDHIDNRRMASGLGRFEILDPIGAGGMGSVYRAYDPKLDRQLAIKVVGGEARLEPGSTLDLAAISPELGQRTRVLPHRISTADDERRDQRLLEEARAMAQLSHPNVVSVYEVGSDGDRLFIAMELVEGRNMREWLAEESPSPPEILAAFRQAAAGLAAAHAAGLVHRDFKPDNVLIGEDGHVQVADFGLALSAASDENSSPVTVAGTPSYMAPELEGGEMPTLASDVFAFCASLVEALQGEPPHPDDAIGSGHGVSRSVARGISRGLSADPNARPEDGAALVRLLAPRAGVRTALIGGSLLAAGVAAAFAFVATRNDANTCDSSPRLLAAWNEAGKASVENRLRSFGGALANDTAERVSSILDRRATRLAAMYRQNCEAIDAGKTADAIGQARAQCLDVELTGLESAVDYLTTLEKPKLVSAVSIADGDARPQVCLLLDKESETVPSEEVAAIWRALTDIRTAGEADVSMLGGKRDELEALLDRSKKSGGPRVTAEVLATLARSEQVSKRYDKAVERLRELIAISPDESQVATATLRLASIVGGSQGNTAEGEVLLALAESAMTRLPHDSRLEYNYYQVKLQLAWGRSDFEASEAVAEKLLTIIDKETEPGLKSQRAGTAAMLAAVLGQPSDALRYAEARTAARLEELGPHHPLYAEALAHQASGLAANRRAQEALVHFDKALAIYAELGDKKKTFEVEFKRANTILVLERFADALPLYAALLEKASEGPEERTKLVGDFHHKMALAHLALGDVEEASRQLAESQLAYTKSFGDSHEKTLTPVLHRAYIALVRKDFVAAKALFLEYRERTKKAYGGETLWLAFADAWVAYYHLENGEPGRALPIYERSIAVIDGVKMVSDGRKASARRSQARCLSDLGRFEEAKAILDDVLKFTSEGTGDDSLARFERARARYELGGGEQALTEARQAHAAIKARPTLVRYQLPRIAAWIKSKEEAR